MPQQIDELTKRVEILESLLENLDGGVMLCAYKEGFPIEYSNRGFAQLTGYSRDELHRLHGGLHMSLVHPADQQAVATAIHQQVEADGHCEVEYRIVKQDGSVVWVMDKGSLLEMQGDRKIQRILMDITKSKRVEQELRISERRHELVMDFVDVTIFDYDLRTKQMHLHRMDAQEYGLSRVMDNAVETMMERGIIQPRSHQAMRELYHRIEQGEPSASAVLHATNADGTDQVIELSLVTIYDFEGKPVSATGIRRDITERVKLEREQQYGNALVEGKVLIFEANVSADSVISQNLSQLLQLELPQDSSLTQMVGHFCDEIVDPRDAQRVAEALSVQSILELYEQGSRLLQFSYRHKGRNGYNWCAQTINIIREQTTGDIIARSYLANIDEEHNRQQELIYKSQHDLLTHLYNKVTMSEKAEQQLLSVPPNQLHAFLLIDLDHFKEVNDTFGHVFGDTVLSEMAKKIGARFRKGDILGRLGGDEFGVLMCELKDHAGALHKAQELCDKVVAHYNRDGNSFTLSLSIGVAFYPEHGSTVQQLYNYADVALYRAKAQGRHCMLAYNSDLADTDR